MHTLEHIPSQELDNRLLEATKDSAVIAMERHIKSREQDPWVAEEIITVDALMTLLPHRHEVKLGMGVGESVEVFLLTEDGIPWYPRDVGNIFNPSGKRPPGNDNDPHEAFPRYWSTEEFQHATASRMAATLLNRDVVMLERQRQQVIRSGEVPYADSSAMGMAYTGFQEGDTSAPYEVLKKKFKEHEDDALATGQMELAQIYQLVGDIYSHMAQDERLHRRFIAANVKAALHCDDPEIQLYMLSAIWDTLQNFTMPLQHAIGAIDFDSKKRFVPIRKAKIFDEEMVTNGQNHLMKTVWKIDRIPNLHGKAVDLQERLTERFQSSAN